MSFAPFMPLEAEYDQLDRGELRERILRGLNHLTNMHRRLIEKEFLTLLDQTLDRNGNRLCCSSVRALFEGRIDGLPAFKQGSFPLNTNRHIREVFAACDFLETVVRLWIDDYMKLVGINYAEDLKQIEKLVGTTKIPGLIEFVMEKQNAIQNEEAGSSHGG